MGKANFPHTNFGLALIYQNQKQFYRKRDSVGYPKKKNPTAKQKTEVRAFLKTYFIGTVCTTFTF